MAAQCFGPDAQRNGRTTSCCACCGTRLTMLRHQVDYAAAPNMDDGMRLMMVCDCKRTPNQVAQCGMLMRAQRCVVLQPANAGCANFGRLGTASLGRVWW
ncbi:hypothetical protein M3J09_012551 [Ascochyta lentis]